MIRSMTRDAALGVREFDFSDRDFETVRSLIYARAGIALGPAKRDMVYGRLARRLRAFSVRLNAVDSVPLLAGEIEL